MVDKYLGAYYNEIESERKCIMPKANEEIFETIKVVKRNGSKVSFNGTKIAMAIKNLTLTAKMHKPRLLKGLCIF